MLDKNKEEVLLEYRSVLVAEEELEPYVIGSARDVTERIRAQDELRKMEERLTQARKMEAVGALASGIAHDFNNTLQAVNGYLTVLSRHLKEDSRGTEHLRQLEGVVGRAGELVRDLLTFGRKMEIKRQPVDLNQVLARSTRILARTIPRMIRIRLDLAPGLQQIEADARQIEQLMFNLGANAKDAMPGGGILTVRTREAFLDKSFCSAHLDLKPGRYLLLTVSDTGQGMDLETLNHIFEPFFTTKKPNRGTGLGLSTVYGIVRQHGGVVICESNPGQGTIFNLYFPVAAVPARECHCAVGTEPTILGGRETILMVDDELTIRETAREVLTEFGYTVLTAGSGEEALALHRSGIGPVDLTVMDLSMPGMGGRTALEEILLLDPEARVIMASGYGGGAVEEEVRAAGARAFIGKPYRLLDMVGLVRRVLDEPRSCGVTAQAVF